jgi:hypothetical protein
MRYGRVISKIGFLLNIVFQFVDIVWVGIDTLVVFSYQLSLIVAILAMALQVDGITFPLFDFEEE